MSPSSETTRVLYVANGHPELAVGGAEVYSFNLYEAMKDSPSIEPVFLARTTAPGHRTVRETCFRAINDDPNQILWFQDNHDYFFMSSPDKEQYTVHLHELLLAYRPDIVHIQHTIGLGIDLIRQIKNSLPDALIVYTLHELLPICAAHGQMRRASGELCDRSSPVRCHECHLDTPVEHFFLREKFVRSHFKLVDLFLCPSEFVRQRYIEWGISPEKILYQENGRVVPDLGEAGEEPPIGRFAFLGQMSSAKGVVVLLEAMELLMEEGRTDIHLYLNGSRPHGESQEYLQRLDSLVERCTNVTDRGRYQQSDLSDRLDGMAWVVVPSIWWENSPLVIQEAFMHQKPVICSDIGGMAEKVTHGVNGLHFDVGNPRALADTLIEAASSRKQWKKLQAGIKDVYSIDQAVVSITSIYDSLLGQEASRGA